MDFVSTENFTMRNPDQNYNAFIFGNSRSQYWQTAYWQKYIGNEQRCYHYYGNGETLLGMYLNIQYINNCGNKIDHALLVLDAELLSQTKAKPGHLFSTPPKTVNYRNLIEFQATNFIAFLNPVFIFAYVDYLLFKTLRPYMQERYFFEYPILYNPQNNEIVDQMFDQAISDGSYYNDQRMLRFKNKQYPDSISKPVLLEENKQMLQEIAHILHHHHTQYKVVISPLFNQIRINPSDLRFIHTVFGKNNVYDFSGKNTITSDYKNYYEESHYRPFIARQLMDSLYLPFKTMR